MTEFRRETPGFREDARRRKEEIEADGGIAFTRDEYGSNMSGDSEYMATSVHFLTIDDLADHMIAHAEQSPLTPSNASQHERLRNAAQALETALQDYWRNGWQDGRWDLVQRGQMAVRHAIDDETEEKRGPGFICPCRTCREIIEHGRLLPR